VIRASKISPNIFPVDISGQVIDSRLINSDICYLSILQVIYCIVNKFIYSLYRRDILSYFVLENCSLADYHGRQPKKISNVTSAAMARSSIALLWKTANLGVVVDLGL